MNADAGDLEERGTNTVGENIIGAPKMRNNSGAIKLFIFPILLLHIDNYMESNKEKKPSTNQQNRCKK